MHLGRGEKPMSNVNERVAITGDDEGQRGFRVPPKLLEAFLDVIRKMGVDFTVESDTPGKRTVRLNSAADRARVAAAIEKFNEGHVGPG